MLKYLLYTGHIYFICNLYGLVDVSVNYLRCVFGFAVSDGIEISLLVGSVMRSKLPSINFLPLQKCKNEFFHNRRFLYLFALINGISLLIVILAKIIV